MKTKITLAAAILAAQTVAFGTGYVFYEHANLKYTTEDSYTTEYRDGRVKVNPQNDQGDPYTWVDQLRNQPSYSYTTDRGTTARMPDGQSLYRDLTPLRRSQTAQGWYLVVLPQGRALHRQASSQGGYRADDLEAAARVLVMHYRGSLSGSAGVAESVTKSWCKALRHQPSYSYTYQGARVTVPSGKALHRELRREGLRGDALSRACRALVLEYRENQG